MIESGRANCLQDEERRIAANAAKLLRKIVSGDEKLAGSFNTPGEDYSGTASVSFHDFIRSHCRHRCKCNSRGSQRAYRCPLIAVAGIDHPYCSGSDCAVSGSFQCAVF
jgi:hypothetical protein